jgi:hypothetical protein
MRILFVVFSFLCMSAVAQEKRIPIIISEHHADHLDFFLQNRSAARQNALLVVLDAHADTVLNENHREPAGNHNWIHPLSPMLERLVWINVIQGFPRNDRLEGFYRSFNAWNSSTRASVLSVNELNFSEITETETSAKTLFVSVDLDFFYYEGQGPQDVASVLNALFAFSSRWRGPVVWGICLSRPWLPDDGYAWDLLELSLVWLRGRPEFSPVAATLFTSRRVDTSNRAMEYRLQGREIPALREIDTPAQIKGILRELRNR